MGKPFKTYGSKPMEMGCWAIKTYGSKPMDPLKFSESKPMGQCFFLPGFWLVAIWLHLGGISEELPIIHGIQVGVWLQIENGALHLTPKGDPWKNGLGCYIREYHGVYRWIYVYNIYMWRYIYICIYYLYIYIEREMVFSFFFPCPTMLRHPCQTEHGVGVAKPLRMI